MIADVPVAPPPLALIDALPAATPETTPVCETVATELFDDAHAIVVDALAGDTVAVS